MQFRPMLFSTPMVQAILYGNKTQTRRLVKPQPATIDFFQHINVWHPEVSKCPHEVDDIIWVRETYSNGSIENGKNTGFQYKADDANYNVRWKPSLFMPKSAARIFLKVVSIHVERLQDIDEQSAINEGIENLSANEAKYNLFKNYLRFKSKVNYQDFTTDNPIWSYQTLWQKINGKDSWDLNPFVWVYKFQRIDEPQGFR